MNKPSATEPFAAMDAETTSASPIWTRAEPKKAEAGFQDPSLGWVAVRAVADGNGVHAAVVPSSSEASRTLGTAMPELGAYLAENHPVQTLTMNSPESVWHGNSAMQSDGGTAGQGSQQGGDPGERRQTSQEAPVRGSVQSVHLEAPISADSSLVYSATGGRYISVIA